MDIDWEVFGNSLAKVADLLASYQAEKEQDSTKALLKLFGKTGASQDEVFAPYLMGLQEY